MSTQHDDRLLDLLADKALFGLDAAEERELADLIAGRGAGRRSWRDAGRSPGAAAG